MMQNTKMNESEWPEELQALLEMGAKDDGEEIFSCMLDDLIYLASLLDLQGSLASVAMICGDRLPEDAWELGKMIREQTDQVLRKWELYAEPSM
ncbi:hypothetical protein [Lacrimispora xylanisolvens]|uniref:hypothetical protein n=1 Tax=Lacrimispora xylanisolvens TaxID=384636 RepID=UPI002402C6C2